MSATKDGAWVGAKFNRKEDHRLTTGKGRFLADLSAPGMLHLTFFRSERAHATIKSIDTAKAKALPGIVAIVTGEDIKDKILPMPQPVVQPGLPARFPKHWPLAVGKVKFHGEPVAAIVSRDKYVGADAAELIQVDYEDLPYVGGAEQAIADGATLVHDDWDDNVIFEMGFTGGDTEESQKQNDEEVEKIMQTADIVIKNRFRVQRCGMTPMETRGVL
ncbi:MAG: xanthine dehydrogenase family protein molybdopterin-binding subunit, partial [Alphaproteobacteria bacterium]|nr:xanthine dehydrogenase family protein molybdopterin-binding subunit [Alphaproteobacteria bacterium]